MKFRTIAAACCVMLALSVPAIPVTAAKLDHTSPAFFAMEMRAHQTIVKAIEADPNTYGGLWYDNETDEFVIQYVTDEQPDLPQADGFEVRWEKVANSKTVLDAQFAAAVAVSEANDDRAMVSVDVPDNTITVDAQRLTSDPMYNDGSGGTSCQDRYDCDPFRAGTGLSLSDGTEYCTLGYMGYNSVYQLRMITAGHCDDRTWYHGEYAEQIGTTITNYLHSSADTDAQKVGADSWQSAASPHNYLYKNDSLKNLSITDWDAPYWNESVQISGSGTGSGYYTATITGGESHAWWANEQEYIYYYPSNDNVYPGDSGGPVFTTDGNGHATILGIVNADGIITGANRILVASNVTPCTTISCHQ